MPKLPPPKESSAWEEKTVSIVTRPNGTRRNIKAFVYGKLCVYKAVENEDYWSVGHIPTGLRCASFKEEADAKKVCRILWDRFSLCFRETERDKVVNRLPKWVEPWLKKCNNEGYRYYEPTEAK